MKITKKKILSGLSAAAVSMAIFAASTAEASANPAQGMVSLSSNLLGGGGGGGFIPQPPAPQPPAPQKQAPATNAHAIKSQMAAKTNDYRYHNSPKKYVSKVFENQQLNNASQAWADEMARTGNFSHDPNLGAAGAKSENIFKSNRQHLTAGDVVNAWGNSPGHQRNMLDGINEMGTGVAQDANGNWYVVARYKGSTTGPSEFLR